jgi:uncharacterized protein (UPF0303 family)
MGSRKKRNVRFSSLDPKNTMTIDHDLETIALQEKRLQFKYFNSNLAWILGSSLKAAAEKRNVAVAIDIQLNGHPLFFFAMPGTTPSNIDWIRRKRNVVMRFHRSSYAIGLTYERDQTTLQAKTGVDLRDFATQGGGFPIFLDGTGCVGSITVSGLPQRADHMLIVSVLQDYFHIPPEELALDAALAP